jgi:hypothetical protein
MKKSLILIIVLLLFAMPVMAAEVDFSLYVVGEGFSEFISVSLSPIPFDIKRMKSVTLNMANGYKGKIDGLEPGEYSLSATVIDRNGHQSGNWEITALPPTIKITFDDQAIPRELYVKKYLAYNPYNVNDEQDFPFEVVEDEKGHAVIVSAQPDASIPLSIDNKPVIVSPSPIVVSPRASTPGEDDADKVSSLWKLFMGLAFFLIVVAIVFIWRKIMIWRSGGFKD